jgi:hypothetical protein
MVLACVAIMAGALRSATAHEAAKETPYYIGAYLYTDRFAAAAAEQNRPLFELFDEHFKKLSDVGINCIHITIVDPDQFGEYIKLAEKYGIKLLPELDFVYFRLEWTDQQMREHADRAIAFLKIWHDNPNVLGWEVKEEPYDADIERLDRYFRMIVQGVPQVQFIMVTSGGGWLTANAADIPFSLVGGDYYYFSWEQGLADKAYMRPPDVALRESRETTELYRRASAKFGVPRIHVFGAAACTIPDRAQGFATGSGLPDSWTSEQKEQYVQKVRQLAMENRQGWSVYDNVPGRDGPQYNLWTLYMPPANCTRALVWGSIMEGANVTMCFSYDPYSKKYNPDSPRDAVERFRTERFFVDLAGRPGRVNDHFDEYAQTVKSVRSYEHILSNLTIQSDTPLDGPPGDNIHARSFSMNGFEGRVLIVHNANVGRILCADCRARSLESCQHVVIDDHGELKDFIPQTKPDLAALKLQPQIKNAGLWDVSTGKRLVRNGSTWMIPINPGDAKLVYLGDESSAEKIHQLYRPFDGK